MQNNGLKLLINKATNTNGAMHDHFWTNLENIDVKFNFFEAYWNDHHGTCISIPLQHHMPHLKFL